MSRRKKKLRNPSPEAVADFAKRRTEQIAAEKAAREAQRQADLKAKAEREEWDKLDPAERQRRLDDEMLAGMSDDKRKQWAEQGRRMYRDMTRLHTPPEGEVTEEEVRGMLGTCARFLGGLIEMAHGVVQTLDTITVRKIVAADVPLTESMRVAMRAAGHDLDKPVDSRRIDETVNETTLSSTDPRKRPRGARHPLMVFMALTVQASRLLNRLTREVWPDVHNLFDKEEKDQRFRARQSTVMNASMELALLEKLEAKLS